MSTILEGADAAQDTSTAYTMAVGDSFFGQMSGGEADWVAVTLTAGHTYKFGAVGIGAAGAGVHNPDIYIHGADGAALPGVFNHDSGPGLTPLVSFTASATATYYIEVDSYVPPGGAPGPVDAAYGMTVTEGDKLSLGIEMGAAMLYRDGGSWAATPETAVSLTYSFRASATPRDAQGDPAPFVQLTGAQQVAVQTALANYSDVANVTFHQVNPGGYSNNATIRIGAYTSTTDGAGAFAYFPGDPANNSKDGDLWLNTDSVSGTALPYGSYSFFVLLHELGHTMGLAHPGDYNAAPGVSITYATSAQFAQDSNQYSVMSYFDATDTEPNAPHSMSDTLMIGDIYAVQQLYGINWSANAGNSVYGFHSNVGGAFDFNINRDPLVCIWDGAGKDTLDLSGFRANQLINLNDGTFSSVGGYTDNLSIAVGAMIENAVGGKLSDVMMGNELANKLSGGAGDDYLNGFAGNDVLNGGAGADHFFFEAGSGKDKVVDFDGAFDVLEFSATLWADVVKTAQEVIDEFGKIVKGHVVFDFGSDELTLAKVTSFNGLAADILIH